MKEIISIVSGKGGVGKSTVASLLGLYYSKNKKVLIIDGDLGLSNISMIYNAKEIKFDVLDVMKGHCEIDEALISINENLDVLNLCVSEKVSDYSSSLLENIIGVLYERYDLFIIDSSAGIEQGFNNVLSITQKMIVVLNDEKTSYSDASKVVRLCKSNGVNNLFYVLNKFNKKESLKKNFFNKIFLMYGGCNIFFIRNCYGDIYRISRTIFKDREFIKLANKLVKCSSIKLF